MFAALNNFWEYHQTGEFAKPPVVRGIIMIVFLLLYYILNLPGILTISILNRFSFFSPLRDSLLVPWGIVSPLVNVLFFYFLSCLIVWVYRHMKKQETIKP